MPSVLEGHLGRKHDLPGALTPFPDHPGAAREAVLELDLLGARFELHLEDPEEYERVARAWVRCRPLANSTDRVRVIGRDVLDGLIGTSTDHAIATHLTQQAVRFAAPRLLMLHAAGVCRTDGRVVALVAMSGMGKTTAATTLSATGWAYVSDEVVAVDDAGSVVPYPRPLLVRDPRGAFAKHAISPDDAGLGSCPNDPTIHGLAVLDRRNDVSTPSVERLPLIDGLMAILPQVSALTRRPRPLQRLCELVDRCGGVHRVTYSEASQLGDVLSGVLDASATDEWAVLSRSSDRAWGLRDGRVRRAPFRDAITTGDEALLLIDRVPVRLAGIGLTAWLAADDRPSLGELTERVVAAHGPHPEATRLVRETLEMMVEAGAMGWYAPRPLGSRTDGASQDGSIGPRRRTARAD